ncbi:T-complex protein 11-like protein 1 [Channa argus]|uniref:T-complex protein 11-like protein 1 n=1 Tax=Channa argus TaxID=215402 RepID=A0A6G1PG58_CHAAH|nr:T-complex protein 11-like protein 1 [Channa argus]
MSTIKERAAALKLAEKLCVRPQGGVVSRDKVVCVCQALLDCNVFESVGTKVFGKEKKMQDVFQDSKSALYRFLNVHMPSVDELERVVLVNGIQNLFCSAPSCSQEEQTHPTGSKVQMSTPVKLPQTSTIPNQLDPHVVTSLSVEPAEDSLSASPSSLQTDTALPQSPFNTNVQTIPSENCLAQCKLLLYGTLVKHYSNTDRPPLLPEHMNDIYTAIIDLLVNAKLNTALEALQLCLKLLPHSSREELCRLLTFMCLAADPQSLQLSKEMGNRLAVTKSFCRAVVHSKALSKDKEDLMVVFMISNVEEIFKIPGALHKEVSDKLASIVRGKQPHVTGSAFCQQVPSKTYTDLTKKTTNQELWALLSNIHVDTTISEKERKRLFRLFYQAHPEIFNQYFGDSTVISSPRFVFVEELMETAKGVTNMALAHEIMVNQAFQVKPQELPEGSLERRVKEIMHKAFWDCLEAQLKEEPPSYGHAIKLLAEIKETLLSFLLPGHGRLHSNIEEVLDLPLIQQQAEKGALDISGLSQFIVGMMGSLCAPCRDKDINKLKEITEIVPLLNFVLSSCCHVLLFIRAIFSVLDVMKVDMANFAVSSIRPHLMQQSVEYERNKFQEFLEKQPNALDYTKKWLEDTVKYIREARNDGSSAASSDPFSLLPHNVHNHAYLRLLKWDHASDPFPETVLMDQVRFQEMQQEVSRLVLLSSVLLIVYTTTGEAISGLPGLMETLKNTVNIILADMHTPSFSAQEALATVGEKLCVELSQCLSQHGYSPFSADRKNTLKGQISATIQTDNTVRKLMDSRVQAYLLASLETSQHKTPPPQPGGLAPVSRELTELAVRFSRLVNFNKLVFSPFYQRILQKLVTSGESPDTDM